ncbi:MULTISPECIES: helix-turn-helix domain-containing protein [unclassified Nonomuraea]|uniref:helix-turn-helix domain-containing protein n=1 Tax=unclassified Nonomuraea TaxID=2593643 RepID=UPI0033E3D5A9
MIAYPSVTLLVDLSEGEGVVYETQGRHERGSVVAGLLPGDLQATGRGAGRLLQIRLEPVAAAALFGASTELSGTVAALEDVWGRDAGQAEDRLRTATSWDERFTIAVDILGRRLGAHPPVDPQVAHAWRRTLSSRGRVRVDGLADEVGWSRKRLWSRFRSQLGITPKHAARLVRFDHAAHLLAAGHAAARVAAENGYVDQSHLHREVATFAGLTPSPGGRAVARGRRRRMAGFVARRRSTPPCDEPPAQSCRLGMTLPHRPSSTPCPPTRTPGSSARSPGFTLTAASLRGP